jgi:hypothetical protein
VLTVTNPAPGGAGGYSPRDDARVFQPNTSVMIQSRGRRSTFTIVSRIECFDAASRRAECAGPANPALFGRQGEHTLEKQLLHAPAAAAG